ncbi:ABC transporter permease [Flaviflexus sp.]|uniref:ABC transporter permease n=1 Tax=Flaviflexus sp. TaxID=1969482 RepID=UPI003F9181C7
MTTAVEDTRSSASAPSRFTGTGFLLSFYLRLDRIRIISWTLGFFLLIWASVIAMENAYPTPEALQGRATLMSNPAAVMMTGPAFALDNYTFGAMLANELALWVFLPTAIMSILLVVRHTRQEEESGRMEVLLALPVGRFAPTTATMGIVAIANIAVSLAIILALFASGMTGIDSVAFGVAAGATGLAFGAIATLTAQLTEHGRTASGMAFGALGIAVIIRGIGDVINPEGSWLSWFSAIAWAQQTKLYVDLRWWPLTLSLALTIIVLIVAIRLNIRRDLGEGIRPTQPGPAEASTGLLSPIGIPRHLLTGNFVGWTIGVFIFAVAFGSLANSIDGMVENNPAIGEWVPISLDDLTLSFAAIILAFLAIGPLILLVSAILHLKSEETEGRVGATIISGTPRTIVMTTWAGIALVYAIISMLFLGLGAGLGLSAATGNWSWTRELTSASAAYLPAIAVTGAIAFALYGITPRFTGMAWAFVTFIAIEVFLGDLLNLPQWLSNLSPIAHVPLVPWTDPAPLPLVAMTVFACLLALAGIAGFKRRNILNS